MNNYTPQWEKAEKGFHSWLKGEKTGNTDIYSDIIKVSFLFNRNVLNEYLNDFCKRSLDEIANREEEKNIVREQEIEFRPSIEFDIGGFDEEFDVLYRRRRKTVEEKNDEIIQGLISGKQEVFNNLYEYEFPKIVKLVIKNNGTIEHAKDIFQDTLVIIIEKILQNEFNLSCSIGTYLYAISKNLWLEKLRNRKKFISILKISFNHSKIKTTLIDIDKTPDNIDKITDAINELGESCKRLLKCYYYENMSWEKIAKEMGYSTAASARNQKYKCLEKIRKQMI